MSQRKLSEGKKKIIAGRQGYKCANKPGSNLKGLEDYDCLLWKIKDDVMKGSFDESGYAIDHILEHCITQDDSEDNLQALCNNCHAVKTKRFLIERTNIDKKDVINNNYYTLPPISYKNILREGITIADIENNEIKLEKKKEFAKFFLDLSNELDMVDDYVIIATKIDELRDIHILNVISNVLIKSAYFGFNIDDKIINKKIAEEEEVNKYFKNV